jgi:zinc D-Ala-D-Ala carboxypeptidase
VKYFQVSEFNCKHCGMSKMDHKFLADIDELRLRYGKPLTVTSGYRCPEYNNRISSTGLAGPHTTGRAADFRVDRGNAYELVRIAMEMGFTGIGVQQKGNARFIHVDDLPNAPGQPRPTVWSY